MASAAPPFGITVCGIDELDGHCSTHASHVLSILDPDYPVPEAFGSYGEHARLELRFHDIIEPDAGQIAPQPEHVDAILTFARDLQAERTAAAHLLVHCHAGVSRSTASMALILAQAMPEHSAETILRAIYELREKAWPNLRLIELGDRRLGRRGTLVAATHALHRLQLDQKPHLAAFMEEGGRVREIDAARRTRPLAMAG